MAMIKRTDGLKIFWLKQSNSVRNFSMNDTLFWSTLFISYGSCVANCIKQCSSNVPNFLVTKYLSNHHYTPWSTRKCGDVSLYKHCFVALYCPPPRFLTETKGNLHVWPSIEITITRWNTEWLIPIAVYLTDNDSFLLKINSFKWCSIT